MSPEERGLPEEPPPPFLGRWRRVYALVVGLLALQVLLYWALSGWAS